MPMKPMIKHALLMSAATVAMSSAAAAGPPDASKEKCDGVAKAGKNDCASKAGGDSCAGHSQKDADPADFVQVPKGLCDKLAGGSAVP